MSLENAPYTIFVFISVIVIVVPLLVLIIILIAVVCVMKRRNAQLRDDVKKGLERQQSGSTSSQGSDGSRRYVLPPRHYSASLGELNTGYQSLEGRNTQYVSRPYAGLHAYQGAGFSTPSSDYGVYSEPRNEEYEPLPEPTSDSLEKRPPEVPPPRTGDLRLNEYAYVKPSEINVPDRGQQDKGEGKGSSENPYLELLPDP